MGTQPPTSSNQSVESCLAAVEELVHQIIKHGGFALSFVSRKRPSADAAEGAGYVLEFSGGDQDLLLEKNGALLDAIESVVLKAIHLDEGLYGKITFDCHDWRQSRVEELKLMARVAAERVIESGDPFTLNPMTARERRIVHLALQDLAQVRTRSEGFGTERKVVIVPASPSAR